MGANIFHDRRMNVSYDESSNMDRDSDSDPDRDIATILQFLIRRLVLTFCNCISLEIIIFGACLCLKLCQMRSC